MLVPTRNPNGQALFYAEDVTKVNVPRPNNGAAHAYAYDNKKFGVVRADTAAHMYAESNTIPENPGMLHAWSEVEQDYVRVPLMFWNPSKNDYDFVV